MKLAIIVILALVTLSVPCSSASAEVCPPLINVLQNLLKGSKAEFGSAMDVFTLKKDSREAGFQLKLLMDPFPVTFKDKLNNLLHEMATSPQCAEGSQAEDVHS
ncbi:uteroglobin [Erinaceus europaeus]|uniref:Uteroglobin n=1 Tax=Erinaceus europaeus TaxID=9365 RepID=A0A1S3WG87_ERIEU|nr:uteroglobin [Erinaceus europaeus]